MNLSVGDILIIVSVIVVIALGVFVYVGKKNYTKNLEAQAFINQHKMVTPILVIDKKYEKPTSNNLPKNIYEKLPKTAKLRKMPIVKAKVGPKVMTLICDAQIYDSIPTKKEVKAVVSGLYITGVKGLRGSNEPAPQKKKFWARFKKEK